VVKPVEVVRALVLGLLCIACGGGAASTSKPTTVVHVVGRGPAIALDDVLTLDAKKPLQLGLFIDAGARDASAPLATAVAAELLGERVGRNARARALPDGLEVVALCDDGVKACAARLARGLALRAPSEAAIARARERIVNAARVVRASDPERLADELALRALWPAEAAGFLPLDPSASATKPSQGALASAVHGFIADAFGPERALVVASGPIMLDELADVVEHAFAKAPSARKRRDARDLPDPELEIPVEVQIDNASGLSIAIAGRDLSLVTRAALQLRDELLRSKRALSVTGHTSSVRGGALAILRARAAGADAGALALEIGVRFERMRSEGLSVSSLPIERDEPLAALRRTGARFIAGAHGAARAPDDPSKLAIGLGVLVRGPRADHVSRADPDAALRAAERERLTRAVQAGRSLASPELEGELSFERASVALANRSHVVVEPVATQQIAIAVKIGSGAAGDPPEQHGRAALLAQAMTVACGGHSPLALRAQLASMGATLEPRVDARSLGIVLRAPQEHARAAIMLAVECALAPSLARGDVTRARLLVRERLGVVPGSGRLPQAAGDLRAQVARVLSAKRAPGELAPWGATPTLASVDERTLSELLARALRGPRVAVAIVGGGLHELGADGAAKLAARRLAELASELSAEPVASVSPASQPARKPASKTAGAKTEPAPVAALPPQAVEALLVWSTPACSGGDRAELAAEETARAFAAAASVALGSSELHVPWLDGDCARGHAWAALLVRGASDRIAALTASTAQAMSRLDTRVIAGAAARSAQQRIVVSGGLSDRAEALADAAVLGAPPPAARTSTNGVAPQALADRLRAAAVRVLAVE
jgi:hypothetical protein